MSEIIKNFRNLFANADIDRILPLLNWIGYPVFFIVGAIVARLNLYNKLAGKTLKVKLEDAFFQYSNSETIYSKLKLNIINNSESKIYINNLILKIDKQECRINTSWNAQEHYRFDKISIEPDEPVTIEIPFNDDLVRNLDSLSFNKEASRIKVILKNNNKIIFSRKLNKTYVKAWNNLIETSKVQK
jgi:hypothetical protein